jgi:hypothetical protein
MDGSHARRFFLEPESTFQRRYEALRAIFVDDEPLDRVARRFGYKPSAMRSMASRMRADCRRGVATPFFSRTGAADPAGPVHASRDRAPRRRTSRTVARWTSRLAARFAPESRVSSSSCPSWDDSDSIGSSPRRGIPARRWSPPPARCSRCWR